MKTGNPYTELLTDQEAGLYWERCYPVGNGSMGMMSGSDFPSEVLYFNGNSLWSGRPDRKMKEPELKSNLPMIRKLVDEKKFYEADILLEKVLNESPCDCSSFLPAGELYIDYKKDFETEKIYRELDLSEAICRSSVGKNNEIEREYFASFPDEVIVYQVRSNGKEKISCKLFFSSLNTGYSNIPEKNEADKDLFFYGELPVTLRNTQGCSFPDEKGCCGISYCMRCRILPEGGVLSFRHNSAIIENARSITLLFSIVSNYKDMFTLPEESGIDVLAVSKEKLNKAELLGFEKLKKRHVEDHKKLYDPCKLTFPPLEEDFLPTFERVKKTREKGYVSPALTALLFHYGRYLLIASSRENGNIPANLQGIWSHKLYAPWGGNYTTNINLQMNYFPAENTDLSPCMVPLLRFLKDAATKGRKTAERLYGAKGWCMHHNSDIWGYTLPSSGKPQWAFWPAAGAWLCRFIAEHYFYTLNEEFLKEYYPILQDCASFLTDFLVKKDGVYTINPSTSPENDFIDPASGKPASIAHGCQLDISLVKEIFEYVQMFAPQCGELVEKGLLEKIKMILPELKKPSLGPYGELLEYGEYLPEIRIQFAHISHLYGLFPGCGFTEEEDEKIYKGCIKSLERRGLTGVGWCLVWRAALWARIGSKENFAKILFHCSNPVKPDVEYATGSGLYPNLFNAHPPFQFDGNAGLTAALAEAFLQSHKVNKDGSRIIELFKIMLPEWEKEGSFTSLRARGALKIDLFWKNGKYTAKVFAEKGGKFIFKIKGKEYRKEFTQGEYWSVEA